MKDNYSVLDKFRNSLSQMEGHFHILEERVPIDIQMKYFKYSEALRFRIDKPNVEVMSREEILDSLNDELLSESDKRQLLSSLAISNDIRHLRILEEYAKDPMPALRNWTLLACMESKIAIESVLSEVKQIYISTGLGGRGEKIRYFVLILSRHKLPFEAYQRDVILKEFPYLLEHSECEIERLNIGDCHLELVLLMPLRIDVKKVIDMIVDECNDYGNFLSAGYTITNMKEFSEEEIDAIINKNERDSNSGC